MAFDFFEHGRGRMLGASHADQIRLRSHTDMAFTAAHCQRVSFALF